MIPFKTREAFFEVAMADGKFRNVLVEFQGFKKEHLFGLSCVVLAIDGREVKRSEVSLRFWSANQELTVEEQEKLGAVMLGEALEKVGVRMVGFVRIYDFSFYA